jgi:hypothetical protein
VKLTAMEPSVNTADSHCTISEVIVGIVLYWYAMWLCVLCMCVRNACMYVCMYVCMYKRKVCMYVCAYNERGGSVLVFSALGSVRPVLGSRTIKYYKRCFCDFLSRLKPIGFYMYHPVLH